MHVGSRKNPNTVLLLQKGFVFAKKACEVQLSVDACEPIPFPTCLSIYLSFAVILEELTSLLLGLIRGRFCPFILQQRPQALQRQWPFPSRLHSGVEVAPQFTHSRPSASLTGQKIRSSRITQCICQGSCQYKFFQCATQLLYLLRSKYHAIIFKVYFCLSAASEHLGDKVTGESLLHCCRSWIIDAHR